MLKNKPCVFTCFFLSLRMRCVPCCLPKGHEGGRRRQRRRRRLAVVAAVAARRRVLLALSCLCDGGLFFLLLLLKRKHVVWMSEWPIASLRDLMAPDRSSLFPLKVAVQGQTLLPRSLARSLVCSWPHFHPHLLLLICTTLSFSLSSPIIFLRL